MTGLASLAPAAGSRGIGGTSIGPLGSDEEEVRQHRMLKRKRSIIEDAPSRDLPTNPDGSYRCRVFRIPNLIGYRLVTDMKRTVYAMSGDMISPAEFLEIKFTPSFSEAYGELILEPQQRLKDGRPDPLDAKRATVDAHKLEVLLQWIDANPHLQIVDYLATVEEEFDREAARDAARLANPSYAARVAKQVRELGVSAATTFEEMLNSKQAKAPAAATK